MVHFQQHATCGADLHKLTTGSTLGYTLCSSFPQHNLFLSLSTERMESPQQAQNPFLCTQGKFQACYANQKNLDDIEALSSTAAVLSSSVKAVPLIP